VAPAGVAAASSAGVVASPAVAASFSGSAASFSYAAVRSARLKKSDVKKKTDTHSSLMPSVLTPGLKPEDFSDRLAYLESLK